MFVGGHTFLISVAEMGGGTYLDDSLNVRLSNFFKSSSSIEELRRLRVQSAAPMRAAETSYCVFLQVRDHYKGFRLHSDKGYTLINAPKWFTLRSCAREFISPEQKINFEVTALGFIAIFCVRRSQKWTEGFFFFFSQMIRLARFPFRHRTAQEICHHPQVASCTSYRPSVTFQICPSD